MASEADRAFDTGAVYREVQRQLEYRAVQAVDAAMKDLSIARGRQGVTSNEIQDLESQLSAAERYEYAVRDIRHLEFTPLPFGTYAIKGYLPVNPTTGTIDGIRHSVDLQTTRVRRFTTGGSRNGMFGLDAMAIIDGQSASSEVTQGIIATYLRPLKDKHAIKEQMIR